MALWIFNTWSIRFPFWGTLFSLSAPSERIESNLAFFLSYSSQVK